MLDEVMFMQQFCGVNVIAYYSSTIFKQGGFSTTNALLGSWGFGMVNFVGALPAIVRILKQFIFRKPGSNRIVF